MDIENIYEFIFLFLADRLNNDKKKIKVQKEEKQ